jgi:phosphate:Na+ symporter
VTDTWDMALAMVMALVGGLGLFMLGMKYMSEGMQAVAGNSLRRMISLVTSNRFTATAAGTGVTVLVQSSTITTVIVVGLVNAGLMQLYQAMGVIIGANIGTTITGWILVLKIGKYGLPILGIAALFYIFSKRDKPRYISLAIMGLGMVFFGLELMKDGVAPMRDMPFFIDAFAWFQADSYFGVLRAALVGCLLTFLVQSSSATLAITISLAATGVIPFETAAALVLGENIGTTSTVMLASIGGTVNAKRSAYWHVAFNVFGVMWITAIFFFYVQLIGGIVEGMHGTNPIGMTLAGMEDPMEFAAVMTAAIALVHTGFNVTNTVLVLPFLRVFARVLERLVPDPAEKEVRRLRHLDARTVSAPVLGIEQSRGEVVLMGQGVIKMMDWIREIGFNGVRDERLIKKTFHREEVLDNLQEEIISFLTEVLEDNTPQSIAEEGRQQMRIALEFESMSDRLSSILKSYLKLRDRDLELSEEQTEALRELHDTVAEFIRAVTRAYDSRHALDDADTSSSSQAITRTVKRLREKHLQLMTVSSVDPHFSLIYTSILTDYRRVRAHAMNIHEAMMATPAMLS